MNDSKCGLQAGVFRHDMEKALHAFEHFELGIVVWNHVPSIRVDAQVTINILICLERALRNTVANANAPVGATT